MNMIPFQISISLAAFATISASACTPPREQPTFQGRLAQSFASAHSAFEANVVVNELIRGPGPAGSDHIRLGLTQRYKGNPSAAALEIRIPLSGTTCDQRYFGPAGSRAVVFSSADGRVIWTVTDQEGLVEARKYLQVAARPHKG
jgi:hypothetical protein